MYYKNEFSKCKLVLFENYFPEDLYIPEIVCEIYIKLIMSRNQSWECNELSLVN